MSVMTLDSVISYLRLKDVTNTCKPMRHSPTIGGNYSVQWHTVQLLAGIIQCIGGKLEEAEYFKCVFLIYCVLELK